MRGNAQRFWRAHLRSFWDVVSTKLLSDLWCYWLAENEARAKCSSTLLVGKDESMVLRRRHAVAAHLDSLCEDE